MNTHRFRALWGCVAVFLAAAVLPLSALPTRSELDAAYTDYIARHQAQELTFGNDVDVGDKLLDLAMTFVGNVEFDSDTVNQIRDDAMNAVELWNTEFKDGGADAMDVYKFMAKTVLPRLGPKELQDLNLSEKTIKWLIDNGTDVTEPLGQAAGTVAGGGSWNEVAEELALSGIDTLCPQCAVARRAVLLASEGGKWMNAWVQDQAISAEFARWEVLGNDIPIGTLAMQGPLMSSARAAIRRQTGSEPTSAEVEKFIADTFRQWKAAKLRKTEDARLLEEVRALFLKQRPHELAEFGVDAEQQAENWAKAYLEVFHELQDIKAAGCGFFPRSDMLSEARLLTYLRQKQTVLKYRQTFRRRLAAYGCKPPPVPDTAERRETRRAHIRDRLLTLEYNRLESVLNYMGVNVPKEFFLCMCRMAGYHAPPARSDFSPGIYVKPPDERYACQQPGPPCIVSGYGCTRHPLINRNHTSAENRQIIESCLEQENGAGRERIDVMLERLMR